MECIYVMFIWRIRSPQELGTGIGREDSSLWERCLSLAERQPWVARAGTGTLHRVGRGGESRLLLSTVLQVRLLQLKALLHHR